MENENEVGVTFGDIIKVINKHWVRLLIITGSIFVVGFLVIYFFLNPRKTVYYETFTVDFPQIEGNKYPDGTQFKYKDFISTENLKVVKESNNDFSTVEVEDMVSSNGISIIEGEYGIDYTADKAPEKPKFTYTITTKTKYFKSKEQAQKFVFTLASYAVDYAKTSSANLDFTTYLQQVDAASTYSTQLSYLNSQHNLIVNNLNSLISAYSGDYTVNGVSLKQTLQTINIYFENNRLSDLQAQLELVGYVKSTTDLTTYQAQLVTLQNEQYDNNKKVENLKIQLDELVGIYGSTPSMAITYESFNNKIAAYTERNVDIDREITVLERYLGTYNPDKYTDTEKAIIASYNETDFIKKINEFKTKLTEFTNTYKAISDDVYSTQSEVTYYTSAINSEGGFSILIALGGPLVGGFVVAAIVNLIADLGKYMDEKKKRIKEEKVQA